MKKPYPPVVILLASPIEMDKCRKYLNEEELYESGDFLVVPRKEEADFFISTDKKQLLICELIFVDKLATDDFVRRMKEKNPSLLAATYAATVKIKLVEPYDICIPTGNRCHRLVSEVKKFLSSF